MRNEITIAEIVERLVDDLERLVDELLPYAKREGAEMRCRASSSPTGYAVSVVMRGHKRGLCGFWGGRKNGGDALDLICEVHGFTKSRGIEWAKRWLGIESGARPVMDPRRQEEIRRRTIKRAQQEIKFAERRMSNARVMWNEAKPIKGTLAESYLIGRGLAPRDWPPTLRFHPSIEYTPGAKMNGSQKLAPGPMMPALICAVQNVSREISAAWRIYLDPAGGKAKVEPNKMGLGVAKGSACRLGPAVEEIGVCEGVETALAIDELEGYRLPIWAALSTSGMQSLVLPPTVKRVRIFPDGDMPKLRDGVYQPAPGLVAAERLAARLKQDGIEFTIEPTTEGFDFLDVLRTANERSGRAGQY